MDVENLQTAHQKRRIKVLLLEDNPRDAELNIRELRRAGYDPRWRLVQTETDFLDALNDPPDLILADYSLPQFDGLRAVELLRGKNLDIPFILISGTLGEDAAIASINHGVDDYLLKDNLLRLGVSVSGALAKKQLRDQKNFTEEELQASADQHQLLAEQQAAILNALPASIALIDPKGVIVAVNDSWFRFGSENALTTPESSMGRNYLDICKRAEGAGSDDARKTAAGIRRVLAGEATEFSLEYACHGPDQPRWFCVTVTPLSTSERTGAVVMHIDITERRLIEKSNTRLATAIDQVGETVVITNTEGKILYTNPAFEKTSGYCLEEVIGKNPSILKSGKQDAEFYHKLWEEISAGRIWSGRFINRRKDGSLYNEEATISPVHDADGTIVNYVGVKRDVTREMELETLFRQSQKMEGIGQLAGGIAHDFNNILAVITLQSDLIKMAPDISPAVRDAIEEVQLAAERAARLTQRLLLFSRKQVMQPARIDLNEVVANLTKMLERMIGEDVSLHLDLHPTPLPIQADAGMIDQVLMNLVVNARDAMPKGGKLLIETRERVVDARQVAENPDAVPGRYHCLIVTDTGCGLAPEIRARIFEPFFTTKDAGKGTGLGLATVFGIVQQHKGWIHFDSEVGTGTSFQIYLPACFSPDEITAVSTPADSQPRGGTETILLVEDDHAVRSATRTLLKLHGYQVLEARDGLEARKVWEENSARIDLLFTDLVMPGGINGRELAAGLRAHTPDLKVILTSGYSANIAGRELHLEKGEVFLPKPFKPGSLLEIIRTCLDS